MMTPEPPDAATRVPKKGGRSIFRTLFYPQLGPAVSPLRDTTRIFVHLVAMVFSVYHLFPKDHPALRDENARLSLFTVLRTAWGNVKLTREGAPQAIIFFAVVGIIGFSGVMAIFALLSLFVGKAHADTVSASSFSPESQDVAQAWIDYLFNGVAMPDYFDQMGNAIPQSMAIQTALTSALAFYSDAILIVAAMVLFYHLAAMVVETAHHGVPMGKRANQIWAPIRLVVAIGLLVPINGGLNCGQYIVIKVAELGSGLASQTWDLFLTQLSSYSPQAIPPASPIVTQTAADLISIEACVVDYNARIDALNANNGGIDLSAAKITAPKVIANQTIGGHTGKKYSFSGNTVGDEDMCGWYFLPNPPSGGNDWTAAITAAAYASEATALGNALANFTADVRDPQTGILSIMPTTAGGTANNQAITLSPSTMNDVVKYQTAIGGDMAALASNSTGQTTAAAEAIKPYGWVFAGTFLPTIARMQAMVSSAVTEGLPIAHGPEIHATSSAPSAGFFASMFNTSGQQAANQEWDIRNKVAQDLANYSVLVSKSWAQAQPDSVQCAAMLGLQDPANSPSGWGGNTIVNWLFSFIDRAAQMSGVWTSGSGQPCGGGNAGNGAGLTTFQVGAPITGADPLAQITSLGHANIDVAFTLLGLAIGAKLGGLAGSFLGGAAGTLIGGPIGTAGGAIAGGLLGGLGAAISGILDFVALVFLICGFTLAFVLPMFPFTRFFFAVLSWVAAIIEAVIAVPLVALAHLNPEGDGLPGNSAKGAYFFIFNIFLRPVLCVFGLIAGLLMFLIAVSFLNYAYNLGVASSGGTAYGHAAMAKIVYSVLYVAMIYVCANHSFMLIDHLPKQALRWMGASGQEMPTMGDAGQMATFEAGVAGYAGQQVLGNISKIGDNIASKDNRKGAFASGRNAGAALKNRFGGEGGDGGGAPPTLTPGTPSPPPRPGGSSPAFPSLSGPVTASLGGTGPYGAGAGAPMTPMGGGTTTAEVGRIGTEAERSPGDGGTGDLGAKVASAGNEARSASAKADSALAASTTARPPSSST